MTLQLPTLCILSVNNILARCVALWNIYRFIMKIFTHIAYNRWNKYRKRKVSCTVSVRFTQLWSKHFQLENSNLINEHVLNREPVPLMTNYIQSTPDNSNLQGKPKKVRVIGSSKKIAESKVMKQFLLHSEHFNHI